MGHTLWNLLSDEAGQDLTEYAVLMGLVALAVITAVAFLGGRISDTFNAVGSSIGGADIVGS